MQVTRFEDPVAFAGRASPVLMQDEARHNLMLGICDTLVKHPEVHPERHLWIVERDGLAVGAALRTPPFNLVVAQPRDDEALEMLAEGLHREGLDLPGVTGARPEVDDFASAWRRHTGCAVRQRMAQGIYRLLSVRPVGSVQGRMRPAAMEDRDLLVGWAEAFQAEALPEESPMDAAAMVDRRLAGQGGGLFVWDDRVPVSLAGHGGSTPNGIRVGPVYTPPEFRGRGFATALVARMSGWLLGRGNRFCFLYTDLANPTSNLIYERIGYELVCESADLGFS